MGQLLSRVVSRKRPLNGGGPYPRDGRGNPSGMSLPAGGSIGGEADEKLCYGAAMNARDVPPELEAALKKFHDELMRWLIAGELQRTIDFDPFLAWQRVAALMACHPAEHRQAECAALMELAKKLCSSLDAHS